MVFNERVLLLLTQRWVLCLAAILYALGLLYIAFHIGSPQVASSR